jgi:hypothetical protein
LTQLCEAHIVLTLFHRSAARQLPTLLAFAPLDVELNEANHWHLQGQLIQPNSLSPYRSFGYP